MIISNTLHNIKVPKSIEHFITILKENPNSSQKDILLATKKV